MRRIPKAVLQEQAGAGRFSFCMSRKACAVDSQEEKSESVKSQVSFEEAQREFASKMALSKQRYVIYV